MGKWTIHQHHYPKEKSIHSRSLASNAWRHYRFSNLSAGSDSFQNNHFIYLKQEHNRKSFLPLQEKSSCTSTLYTVSGQCFAADPSTAGVGASRRTLEREREKEGFGFNKPSQQELETCIHSRMARFTWTFTPAVDKWEECVSEGARPCPGAWTKHNHCHYWSTLTARLWRMQRSKQPNMQSKHSWINDLSWCPLPQEILHLW